VKGFRGVSTLPLVLPKSAMTIFVFAAFAFARELVWWAVHRGIDRCQF